MVDGFRKLACTLTGTIHEMNWGATTADGKTWLGVNGVKSEFNKLINSLENDLPTKINARFSGNADQIRTDYESLLTTLENVYSTYRTTTVPDPRPGQTAAITPDYFGNLGPSKTSGKELYPMYLEIKTKFDATIKSFQEVELEANGISAGSGLTSELKT